MALWAGLIPCFSPSPGTPGEGRGEGSVANIKTLTLPLPEYRARGKKGSAKSHAPDRAQVVDCSPAVACRYSEPSVVLNAAAAHGHAAAIAPTRTATSLAALLAGHILQDGEIVLLILKPSLWFILLSTLRFGAVVLILMIAAKLLDTQLPGGNLVYQELGLFVLVGRLMFAVLQWMGRLYILTDLRILRLSGVFHVDIFGCPLRKVARTRLIRSTRERLTRLGTIEIIPSDETFPIATWNMIARPIEVREQIVAAINKAKQCGPTLPLG